MSFSVPKCSFSVLFVGLSPFQSLVGPTPAQMMLNSYVYICSQSNDVTEMSSCQGT